MKIANSLIRLFYTLMNRRIPKQNTIKQDTSIDRTMHYMNIGINNENMFTIVLNEIEKSIAEKIVSIKNAIFLVLAAVVAMLCCLIAEVKNLNNIGVVVIVVASAVSGISLFATCGTRAYYSPNKKKQKKTEKGH